MRIILANPPWSEQGLTGVRAGSRWPHLKREEEEDYMPYPFFLGYSSSLLKKNGFNVLLKDAIAEEMKEDDFIRWIKKNNSDLIFLEISAPSLKNDIRIIKKIRQENSAKIAVYAPDGIIRKPEFLKKNKEIDFVLYGEYEYTLLELAKTLKDKDYDKIVNIKGTICHDGLRIKVNPKRELIKNLDDLPWPDRKSVPIYKYHDSPGGIKRPTAQMWTSRGCPFQCIFCAWPQLTYGGSFYRTRSIKDVVNEMEYLINVLHFRSIYIDDDTTNVSKKRMIELAEEIIKRKSEKRTPDFKWAMMARADLMDWNVLKVLKKSGLYAVKYGVESADQGILDAANKNLDIKKAIESIRATHKLGIKTHLTFTFGLPKETWGTIIKTIQLAIDLDPESVQFSIATPFPGTKFYDLLKSKNQIVDYNTDLLSGNFKSAIKTESLSPNDLVKAQEIAYQRWHEYTDKRNRQSKSPVKLFFECYKEHGVKYTSEHIIKYIKEKGFRHYLSAKKFERKSDPKLCIKDKDNSVHDKKPEQKYIGLDKRSMYMVKGILSKKMQFVGPEHVQIDLTNKCNSNCIGCWTHSPLIPDTMKAKIDTKSTLDTFVVLKTIDDLAAMGTKEIYLSGGGEPSLHPDLLPIIKAIKRNHMICHLNTNFTLFSEDDIKKIVKSGLDHIVISMWAGTEDVYKKIHPKLKDNTFKKVVKNIKYLSELKRQEKTQFPLIKLYNVVFSKNYDDFSNMIKLGFETNADSVEFTPIDTIPKITDKLKLTKDQALSILSQFNSTYLNAVNEYDLKTGSYKISIDKKYLTIFRFSNFSRRISSWNRGSEKYDQNIIDSIPCYTGWTFSRIMANGNVIPCLKAHNLPVGNIYKESFRKIWDGEKMEIFRTKAIGISKHDKYFMKIGNGTHKESGCYRGCDDVGRNIETNNLIISLDKKKIKEILGLKGSYYKEK